MQHHYLRGGFHFSEGYAYLALHRLFFTLSVSLLSVFIPIYLLSIEFPVGTVFAYLVVVLTTSFVSIPVLKRLAEWKGVSLLVLMGMGGIFVFQIFLENVTLVNWQVFAVVQGVVFRSYWIGMLPMYLLNTDHRARGGEMGILATMNQFSGLIGPVVGGIVVTFFSFNVLFLLAGGLLLLGAVPMLDQHHTIVTGPGRKYHGKDRTMALLIMAEGALGMGAGLLWPIALYFLVTDFVTLGSLATLQSLGGVITALTIGWLSDRNRRGSLIRFGAVFGAMVWFARPYVLTVMDGVLFSFLGGIAYVATTLPFFIAITDRMEGFEGIQAMAWREQYIQLGKLTVAAIVFWVFLRTQNVVQTFEVGFSVLGIISLLFLFYREQDRKDLLGGR